MSTVAEAPTFVPAPERARLRSVVPFEVFRPVRLTLMISYLLGYLWWLRVKGLPIDRISVAISVGHLPRVRLRRQELAHLGHPAARFGVLLRDVARLRTNERRRRRGTVGLRPVPRSPSVPGRIDAQHRSRDVLRSRPQHRVAGPLLGALDPLVRRGCLHDLHDALRRPDHRDGRAVGHQSSSMGAVHEALRIVARHRVRCCS